ncbi:MAG: hypothetical protein ABH821_05470 [archaeon]
MKGFSKKEIELISWLEFHEKYFFTGKDVEKFSKDKVQKYNIIKKLVRKKRIIKINRSKYFLVPIKAKSGSWREHPFIIVDEICNGKDYFIGGWSAANYWQLTDQIPMRVDVYTTRRQGKMQVMNTKIVFHRTTRKRLSKAVTKEIKNHSFRILSKGDSRKWMKSRT